MRSLSEILCLAVSVIALAYGPQAQAADVFLERKVMLFPGCREKAEVPEKGENFAIIAINDPAEVNAKPCDRNCMLEKRYSTLDVKNHPILNEFLASAKKAKLVTGKFKEDGLIAFPDIGVCIFVDSINSKIEIAKKTYSFDPQILHRLRDSLRVPPPKF